MSLILSTPTTLTVAGTAAGGSFQPPYARPSAGQAIKLARTAGGDNTLLSVATPENGWNSSFWSMALTSAISASYSGMAFASTYSQAGAFVIAGSGAHGSANILGGFLFDFTTGKWVSKANTNGVPEQADFDFAAANVSYDTGLFTNPPSKAGQLPAPSHLYTYAICPPKDGPGVPSSSKGYFIKPILTAVTDKTWDIGVAYKFDLDTALWTRATNNDARKVGFTMDQYTDTRTAYDPTTGRIYHSGGLCGGYGNLLQYMAPHPTYGWTWTTIACPVPDWKAAVDLMFVDNERRALIYKLANGIWRWVDLTSDATINQGPRTLKVNDTLPAVSYHGGNDLRIRFHKYPTDGCFYAYDGRGAVIPAKNYSGLDPKRLAARQYLYKLAPPAGDWKTGTWTLGQHPITGGITALAVHQYDPEMIIFDGFTYVPAINCFAWFPRIDAPLELIKP
jgi:hypothetical protein